MVAQEELIMVCIDNSQRTSRNFWSQLDAIHLYCHAKLKSNPKIAVGLCAMGLGGLEKFGCLLVPTSDLVEIMDCVQGIACDGQLDFVNGITRALMFLECDNPNVQKRMLIFTGGPTEMGFSLADKYGKIFKVRGIAVDLLNFCLEEEHKLKRHALNAFVATVNNNGNSHIKHILAGSSIHDVLSSTPAIITHEEIAAASAAAADLKKTPRLPRKEKVIQTVDKKLFEELRKGKSQAAADYDYVKAMTMLSTGNKI